MKRALLFSGQGSQYYHMGRELYKSNLCFRKSMLKLDDIVYDINGKSVLSHLYNDNKKKSEPFKQISYSHLAIFMIEFSLTQLLIEQGIYPDYLLGASLGEFVCAAVANIVPAEIILEMIIKQTELIKDFCPEGAMIAVLHNVNLYYSDTFISERSKLAGINFPGHFIISGLKNDLSNIEIYLGEKNISFHVLPVPYGFHSNGINTIKDKYIDLLKDIKYKEAAIPFFSCSQINKVESVTADYFWGIISKPIMFQKLIVNMENTGSYRYLDLTPTGTLSTFIKYNFKKLKSQSGYILNPYGKDLKQLEFILNSFKN